MLYWAVVLPSVLALYSDDPSFNPSEVDNFYLRLLLK